MAANPQLSISNEPICATCGRYSEDDNITVDSDVVSCNSDIVKCQRWLLEKCQMSDGESMYSEASSNEFSCQERVTEDESSRNELETSNICSRIINENGINTYGDVKVQHSKHVLIGNKTIINGPIYITHTTATVKQENIVNQIFLEATGNMKPERKPLRIVSRRDWLAQPPIMKNPLPETVEYVVISHTATEEGFTNADNVHLIRLTQSYHIEGRKWDDIAYNFLVGSDGVIYEGRGWGFQGAFAYGYNRKSIGISFVGCFMNHLPPTVALNACQDLIEKGIELGYIPAEYTLVGHCQCSAVESPGKKLYEEIKTWPRWRELTADDV